MENKYNTYANPLIDRYCSKDMSYIFSPQFKFSTWRKLWVALAESEKELGLNITDEQINELKANINNIQLKLSLEIAIEVPNIIPLIDSGKVLNLAAFIHIFIMQKSLIFFNFGINNLIYF